MSEVIQVLLLRTCELNLATIDLQFGYKGLDCSDIIASVKPAVSHYVERDSSVYAATQDLTEAFDSVNYYSKLHNTMIMLHFDIPGYCECDSLLILQSYL